MGWGERSASTTRTRRRRSSPGPPTRSWTWSRPWAAGPEAGGGPAGTGDRLCPGRGGRTRLYGELVGAGDPPDDTLRELEGRGLTVEGVDSTRDVLRLATEHGLELPFHEAIHRVLFDGAR